MCRCDTKVFFLGADARVQTRMSHKQVAAKMKSAAFRQRRIQLAHDGTIRRSGCGFTAAKRNSRLQNRPMSAEGISPLWQRLTANPAALQCKTWTCAGVHPQGGEDTEVAARSARTSATDRNAVESDEANERTA